MTVKCCTLLSPVTIALFTGPSLSSERVTQDPSATRDSERYLGDGLGRESESSDSETEETSGRKEKNGALFNVDEWIALSASQEVVVVILKKLLLLPLLSLSCTGTSRITQKMEGIHIAHSQKCL